MGVQSSRPRQAPSPMPTQKSLAEDALWRAVTGGNDGDVQAVLQKAEVDTAELVNTRRELTDEETQRIKTSNEDEMIGNYSILYIAIRRGLHEDARYLIRHPNIALHAQCGGDLRTPLFEAVARANHDIVLEILECPFVSPSQYINVGDRWGNTPLHQIALNCEKPPAYEGETEEKFLERPVNESSNLRNLQELLLNGANVDALNHDSQTPLHILSSKALDEESAKCVDYLLDAGAEVNTKDEYGDSPLHAACKTGDHGLIRMLVECGADLDSRNLDWKTAQDLFYESRSPPSQADYEFAVTEFSRLKKTAAARKRTGNYPKQPAQCPEETRKICSEFPIYFRYHWPGLELSPDSNTSMSWVRTDMKVSQILYPKEGEQHGHFEEVNGGPRFLCDNQKNFTERIWKSLTDDEEAAMFDREEKGPDERSDEDKKTEIEQSVNRDAWRWINFPANNMTWMKDFIIHNFKYRDGDDIDRRVWRFFENSIRIRETSTLHSRVRTPHVHATKGLDPDCNGHDDHAKQEPSGDNHTEPDAAHPWSDTDWFARPGRMLSMVVPFLDIETEDQVKPGLGQLSTQCQRIKKLNQAYFPFTGMHGVQTAQTLDQTSYSTGKSDLNLRSEKMQVIYRWCQQRNKEKQDNERRLQQDRQDQRQRKKQSKHKLQGREKEQMRTANGNEHRFKTPQQKESHVPLKQLWAFLKQPFVAQEAPGLKTQRRPTFTLAPHDTMDIMPQERAGGRGGNAPNAERIRQDPSPKWLMVRQLWLWKLDDNTILTAIPSRKNGMIADTLLETIRQGNLDVLRTPEDLIKRILNEAVTFLDEFKWAGLGEHVLDIFQGEIAFETDQEAKFFREFTDSNWSAKAVDKTVQDAAESTWRVKDIRDELRLLRQVFETQLKVVDDFAEIFWPTRVTTTGGNPKHERDHRKVFRESFVRDSGLGTLIERVKQMDEDASTTLQGLSNIIQAMQAQAALKEAEAARVMNIIILPFTIVTVIFTPLSFLTSLFAVNSLGFPHNEEGELRLPSSWFTWRMVVGEIGSLVPLLLLVLLIYFWYTKPAG